MKLPTERECVNCEEATYVDEDGDLYCPNCFYVSGGHTIFVERLDPWELFWQQRAANYDGFKGQDRAKMVGGFAGAWPPEKL